MGITGATFIFNTSEFIPIGLLSSIASDFGIDEAKAGMLVSVYALVVMLMSLPLMLLVSRMNLRRLFLGVVFLFVVFQVMSYFSSGYYMLMASRIGVACTHSVFWSVVSPLAVRIVSGKHRALALSMVVTGSSVAMIFGMPMGRMIGLWLGWRATFLCIGVFAFLTFVYVFATLPDVPSRGGFKVGKLPGLLNDKVLLALYAITFLFATSYYTGYSYIEPFMGQVAKMNDGQITATLMLFGFAGITGSVLFSKCYMQHRRRFTDMCLGTLASVLLLLYPLSFNAWLVTVLCMLWGTAVTAYNVAMQSELIEHTGQEATAVAMSIYSGIFNLGIGSGAFIGGKVCDTASVSGVGLVGGLLAVVTFLFWIARMRKIL